MSIFPLPVFEADADPRHRSALTDQEVYDRLEAPRSIVVRFGRMKLVAELPYDGQAKPGCGSKLVARTFRGTELVEMLTTTCENSGCGKSISRRELLDYVENSGGRDYPFHTRGAILRVATVEDLNRQSEVAAGATAVTKACREIARELGMNVKIVEAEPILGGELLTVHYLSEERLDMRDLIGRLGSHFGTNVEMRQVGARDEARLVADYERCGQYCCCKGFLKVLKPVSMTAAKMQKATLDPLKISGRCGRLMCCLRYEDQTYKELKANLPRRRTRVGTPEGPGIVIDGKILVQLVLVQLEHDGREIAIPVEELLDPETCPKPGSARVTSADPLRGMPVEEVQKRTEEKPGETPPERRRKRRRERQGEQAGRASDAPRRREAAPEEKSSAADTDAHVTGTGRGETSEETQQTPGEPRRGAGRKRRRRKGPRDRGPRDQAPRDPATPPREGARPDRAEDSGDRPRRRRRGGRRRRRGGPGGGENSPPPPASS